MLRSVLGLVILVALLVPVSADAALPPWAWNTYSGTTMWQVTVTESDSGCGGAVYSNQYTVPIQVQARDRRDGGCRARVGRRDI